jgi:hypothetical protein
VRGVSIADASQILAAAMLLLLIYGFRKSGFAVPLNVIMLMPKLLVTDLLGQNLK